MPPPLKLAYAFRWPAVAVFMALVTGDAWPSALVALALVFKADVSVAIRNRRVKFQGWGVKGSVES